MNTIGSFVSSVEEKRRDMLYGTFTKLMYEAKVQFQMALEPVTECMLSRPVSRGRCSKCERLG